MNKGKGYLMKKIIKAIELRYIQNEIPYRGIAIIGGTALIMAGGLVEMLIQSAPSWVPMGLLLCGGLHIILLGLLGSYQDERCDMELKALYAKMPVERLKKLSVSPERSPSTRDLIISVLNKEHPGWSLQ